MEEVLTVTTYVFGVWRNFHNSISCTLEYVVFVHLTLIGFNNRINNRQAVTVFVEEISLETGIETVL